MFSVHMDLQSRRTCINFICSFVGRPAWNSVAQSHHILHGSACRLHSVSCQLQSQQVAAPGLQDSSLKKHPTDRAGCVQLRVVSPQHGMYSISHNTLCSTTVKCMTDTQLYCLKFMCLVYTYSVCHVILCTYGVPTVAV